jgi:hypothetical protein
MRTAVLVTLGLIFGLLTGCAGFGLFISGIIAGSTTGGYSASACAPLRVHEDCQDKCGCGWCDYGINSSLSSCQPRDNYHCSKGTFDSKPSDRCQSLYDERIIVVVVFASLFGAFGLLTCSTCLAACFCSKSKFNVLP